jgi:hypothetical protein
MQKKGWPARAKRCFVFGVRSPANSKNAVEVGDQQYLKQVPNAGHEQYAMVGLGRAAVFIGDLPWQLGLHTGDCRLRFSANLAGNRPDRWTTRRTLLSAPALCLPASGVAPRRLTLGGPMLV